MYARRTTTTIVIVSACSVDDKGLKVQSHNDNELMSIVHSMSTEMDVMQMMTLLP